MLLTLIAVSTLVPQASAGAEITIYNQGFALVKQNRTLHVAKGRQKIAIEDVAAQIEPSSVGFRSLGSPLDVLEQNYQYDLISPEAILNKSVGLKVRFVRVLPNSRQEVLVGTLVSSPTSVVASPDGGTKQTYNGMVIRTDDGRTILDPTGEVEVSSIPEGLISRPTLVWDVDAAEAGDTPIELSYLTQQIGWNADYVLTLNEDSSSGDLEGWVTLTNNSGASFKNARLKLLAGDVNRVAKFFGGSNDFIQQDGPEGLTPPAFKEEGLFEYHLYTLQRPTDVNNKETKQVSLLEGHGVQTTKKLVFDPQQADGTYYPDSLQRGVGKTSPQVRIEFMNSEANHLGMPLPQGNIKIYERDKEGSVQMVGENAIKHTPKDEKISLVAGRAFDVIGERKRVANHKIDSKSYFEKFEITVRNHKPTDQKIYWVERHYGDWKVTEKSMDFTKLDSDSMQFEANIPANGTKTIVYSVVTKS
jgi:hypothetical protein